jgi:integrase
MSTTTLRELFDRFEGSSTTQGTTRAKCRCAWLILMHLLGADCPADQVKSEDIDRLQRYLRDEALSRFGRAFAEHSVFSYVAALGQVFHWAAHPDRLYVTVNPVAGCNRMKPTAKTVSIYATDELKDVLDVVRGNPDLGIRPLSWPDQAGPLRWTAFILAGLTGPRLGEIWNLRWDDIDLDTGVLRIQSRRDRPGEFWRWTAKGKAERLVPMSDELWAVLCRLRTVAPWRYPFLKERTCIDKQSRVGRLSEIARKYPSCNFHRELNRIIGEANLWRQRAGRPPIRDGRFHTLRKNAATQLAEQGVPSHFCQEILGHATDRLTKQVYTFVDQRKCLADSRRAFNAAQY